MSHTFKYKEEAILKRVLKGDQEACKILVDKYKDFVFSLVLNIVKDYELAEEVTQDSFVKMFKALAKFEKKAKFSTWLYSISYRSAIDAARKRKRELGISGSEELMVNESMDQLNPEAELIAEERKNKVRNAILKLNPDDGAVVTLFYMEERSVKEIAKIMQLSESNIKVKLFRARNELKNIIKDQI